MQRFSSQYLGKLAQIREDERGELVGALEGLRGRKCLVTERSLRGLLGMFRREPLETLLSELGVHFHRDLTPPGASQRAGRFAADDDRDVPDHIVYLIRPSVEESRVASREIAEAVKRGVRSQFHVLFVPSRSVVCEQLFEDEGASNCTTFGELNIGLLPLDTDLFTMEMPDVFRQCYLDGDTSSLGSVARALMKLQKAFGVIPHVSSKGAAAKKVLQLLLHYRREEEMLLAGAIGGDSPSARQMPLVDTMVLLDRDVDLFSVMVSPLTYEGLIDEVVGIHTGKIHVDASVLGDEKDELKLPQSVASASGAPAAPKDTSPRHLPGEKVYIPLDSNDSTYADIRDLSIEQLGAYLQDRAVQIKTSYSNFREKKDASIVEIHDFVKKIPKLTSEYKYLTQHINIAQLIRQVTDGTEFRELWQMERGMMEGETFHDQIEDAICADADRSQLCRVLRLMALQSLTGNGIRAGRYDQLRRLVVMTYGFHHTFTLNNLEKIGLLKRKDMVLVETSSSLPWNMLRRNLRLINESVAMVNPSDMAYVSAGYAPLSARLVQTLSAPGGWGAIAETQRLLPGPVVEISQTAEAEELARTIQRSQADKLSGKGRTAEGIDTQGDLYLGPVENEEEGDAGGKEPAPPQKPTMLVVFVGGLSFIEVAALRFLSKSADFPYSIVMASTNMVNGNSLIESIVHNPTIIV